MNQHFVREADLELEVTTLPNGLTVVTERMPYIKTATLGVWVGAGSRNEREAEHGLSHLIEHMAFKGTRRRSARRIAEDIENVGGEINAATSVEFTNYTARVLGETIGVALDVLGDILTESSFEESVAVPIAQLLSFTGPVPDPSILAQAMSPSRPSTVRPFWICAPKVAPPSHPLAV